MIRKSHMVIALLNLHIKKGLNKNISKTIKTIKLNLYQLNINLRI